MTLPLALTTSSRVHGEPAHEATLRVVLRVWVVGGTLLRSWPLAPDLAVPARWLQCQRRWFHRASWPGRRRAVLGCGQTCQAFEDRHLVRELIDLGLAVHNLAVFAGDGLIMQGYLLRVLLV